MDRFLFKVVIGSPKPDELREIMHRTTGAQTYKVQPNFAPGEAPIKIEELKQLAREVMVSEPVERYIISIITACTPGSPGATPEITQYLRFGPSSSRRAGADSWRQGQCAARGPRQRQLRGYRRQRCSGAAPSPAAQLPGRGGKRFDRATPRAGDQEDQTSCHLAQLRKGGFGFVADAAIETRSGRAAPRRSRSREADEAERKRSPSRI